MKAVTIDQLHLRDHIRFAEDQKNLDLMADLVWIATITFEFGFQCPKSKHKQNKHDFFNAIRDVLTKKEMPSGLGADYDYEHCFKHEKRLPSKLDLVIVCGTALNLTNSISVEKLIEWLDEAWQWGTQQQQVYGMEIEGGIMNEYGIVNGFGAKLAMDESFMSL